MDAPVANARQASSVSECATPSSARLKISTTCSTKKSQTWRDRTGRKRASFSAMVMNSNTSILASVTISKQISQCVKDSLISPPTSPVAWKKAGLQGVPVAVNVMEVVGQESEWPPHAKSFMQRGGTFFSVGSLSFESAMDQDLWAGDGEYMEEFADEYAAFPAFRNDHEIGFVSGMCGYN